jgi:hypothetical protein
MPHGMSLVLYTPLSFGLISTRVLYESKAANPLLRSKLWKV